MLYSIYPRIYHLECLVCKNIELIDEEQKIINEEFKKTICKQCNSKKFTFSSSWDDVCSLVKRIVLNNGQIICISYYLFNEFDGSWHSHNEPARFEKITISKTIKREIFLYCGIDGEEGDLLVMEEYDLHGKLIDARCHKFLEGFFENKRLEIPQPLSSNPNEIFEKIGIDQMERKNPDKNDGFTIRQECECLFEIPFNHLIKIKDKHIIKNGFYSWNQSEKFTGFVKKTINLNHDYKRIYIVDGEVNLAHPAWTFDKNNYLLSLDCKIGDKEFNLFKYNRT